MFKSLSTVALCASYTIGAPAITDQDVTNAIEMITVALEPLLIPVGKGKVICINCDIRNALLHQTTWGVHGYSYESAMKLTQQLCN